MNNADVFNFGPLRRRVCFLVPRKCLSVWSCLLYGEGVVWRCGIFWNESFSNHTYFFRMHYMQRNGELGLKWKQRFGKVSGTLLPLHPHRLQSNNLSKLATGWISGSHFVVLWTVADQASAHGILWGKNTGMGCLPEGIFLSSMD